MPSSRTTASENGSSEPSASRLSTPEVMPPTTRSATAATISSLPAKYRYAPPADIPAAARMSSIEVAWKPLAVNTSVAASTIRSRRS